MDADGVTCLGMRGPAGVGGRQAGPNGRRPQGPLRDEGGKEGPVGAIGDEGWGKREKVLGAGERGRMRGMREGTKMRGD